jgi:hypothetical protein
MTLRPLTEGERRMARTIFGDAIDYDAVRVKRRRWFPFQPRNVLMAPTGHIHAHPRGTLWSADYSKEAIGLQALFMHELTHVWQSQTKGRFYLPLMRHPFCRYGYQLAPGRAFQDYGLEQQAEIVRHAFLQKQGRSAPGAPSLQELSAILPFKDALPRNRH